MEASTGSQLFGLKQQQALPTDYWHLRRFKSPTWFRFCSPAFAEFLNSGADIVCSQPSASKCKTSPPHISSREALFMPWLLVCFWWLRSTCLWRCPFLSVLSLVAHTLSFRWIIRWLPTVLFKVAQADVWCPLLVTSAVAAVLQPRLRWKRKSWGCYLVQVFSCRTHTV